MSAQYSSISKKHSNFLLNTVFFRAKLYLIFYNLTWVSTTRVMLKVRQSRKQIMVSSNLENWGDHKLLLRFTDLYHARELNKRSQFNTNSIIMLFLAALWSDKIQTCVLPHQWSLYFVQLVNGTLELCIR